MVVVVVDFVGKKKQKKMSATKLKITAGVHTPAARVMLFTAYSLRKMFEKKEENAVS